MYLGGRVGEGVQDLVGGNLRLTGNVRSRCRFRQALENTNLAGDEKKGAGSGMMADAGFSSTNRC